MFAARRLWTVSLALGIGISLPAEATTTHSGKTAEVQTRHIATVFPGRMTGSPAEMLAADYLQEQFIQYGYQSDIRRFNTRYRYTTKDGHQNWHNVSASQVIAAREGKEPQQVIIIAHLDTFTPLSDADTNNNLGGLTLQGVDDNASGLGVMLELAQSMAKVPTRYGIRFIATSGEEMGGLGAENILSRMSDQEKKNTLLVINLDSLVTGDRIYFNSGLKTPAAVRKLTRDRALQLARQLGIQAATNPGQNKQYPKGTGCCNDAAPFDKVGIPVLSVEATNWSLGKKDGYQQRAKSKAFPDGTTWHNAQLDNQQYLDKWLSGRIAKRSHDVVRVMLPLVKELTKAGK
ncbi:aminopeptidase [Dryocola clanedunensis]|uniref:aminopeptidase n=1 Tax=Cedecea sulfonylureivorans TaxID=3051154 RepID=UPI0019280DA2|nr:aminopeptidase [Cedecea sulfonylureivorans]